MELNEAIEIQEKELEELEEDLEKFERVLNGDPTNFFNKSYESQAIFLREEIKQKNIALESMRLVRKQTHIYPQGVVFANRWLTQEEIDSLGLREESK